MVNQKSRDNKSCVNNVEEVSAPEIYGGVDGIVVHDNENNFSC